MPDWLQIAIGCLARLMLLIGVVWISILPSKRRGSSYFAPPSGIADEGAKYNEQVVMDP